MQKNPSRKKLRWLVSLMALSFIGIAGIQSYWFYNAFEIKEEKFDRQVGEALNDASQRIENLESIRFLFESFRIKPFFSGRFHSFLNSTNPDSAELGRRQNFNLEISLGRDTFKVFNTSDGATNNLKTLILKRDSTQSMIRRQGSSRELLKKAHHLDVVLRKMIINEMQRQMGINQMLSKDGLDSILSFELQSRGINLPYNFAVYEDGKRVMQSENFEEKSKATHRAALFPNDIFNDQILAVNFPGKTNYLLRSMWWVMIIGLILTSIMVLAFYKTLQFSLRQKRISEIKTDFINNMTHEFKTPIATINLAIDALRNPAILKSEDKVQHYSEIIRQENQRMNLQVESVLRMALMDKQELELQMEWVAVGDLIEKGFEPIKLQLQNHGGSVVKYINHGKEKVKVDRSHMANVILNILDNAIKYSHGAPHIEIKTEEMQGFLIISISDNGLGMTNEEKKYIFDRFYRVSRGDVHDIKGHGLGLSYAKGVVEAHGGRIEVESEKGKGSKFYIYIPY